MKSFGKEIKALGGLAMGGVPFDADKVAAGAKVIKDGSSGDPMSLFPQDSLDPPSEALPAIWENWDEFAGLFQSLNQQAAALEAAASDDADPQGAVKAAFMEMAGSCQTCHTKFRKEQEQN